MKGILSFHPVHLGFFDRTAAPLIAGETIDLDPYLDEAVRARRWSWQARRYGRALGSILAAAQRPRIEPIFVRPRSATDLIRSSVGLIRSPEVLLKGIKARLDQFDHQLDDLSKLVVEKVDPDLHLFGRPFFITEGSPQAVAESLQSYCRAPSLKAVDSLAMEQLVVLDSRLAQVDPEDGPPLSADLAYRSDIFQEVQVLRDLPAAVRKGRSWTSPEGDRVSALDALKLELPWIAVRAHARVAPFWAARDVDGLDTMCRRAEIPTPAFLSSPLRLFREACTAMPEIADSLHGELQSPRDVGGFVAPECISDLIHFLTTHGAQIIRTAARHGEGATASTVLKKIRECAVYAERHGLGYLETSGILPPDLSAFDLEDGAILGSRYDVS